MTVLGLFDQAAKSSDNGGFQSVAITTSYTEDDILHHGNQLKPERAGRLVHEVPANEDLALQHSSAAHESRIHPLGNRNMSVRIESENSANPKKRKNQVKELKRSKSPSESKNVPKRQAPYDHVKRAKNAIIEHISQKARTAFQEVTKDLSADDWDDPVSQSAPPEQALNSQKKGIEIHVTPARPEDELHKCIRQQDDEFHNSDKHVFKPGNHSKNRSGEGSTIKTDGKIGSETVLDEIRRALQGRNGEEKLEDKGTGWKTKKQALERGDKLTTGPSSKSNKPAERNETQSRSAGPLVPNMRGTAFLSKIMSCHKQTLTLICCRTDDMHAESGRNVNSGSASHESITTLLDRVLLLVRRCLKRIRSVS